MTDRRTLFSLDGFCSDRPCVTYDRAWVAVSFGPTWNGWATPLVTREVAVDLVAQTSPMLSWDGDALVMSTDDPADYVADHPEDYRIRPDKYGLYDLGQLGWVFDRLGAGDTVLVVVSREGEERSDSLRLAALRDILTSADDLSADRMSQEQYDHVNREAYEVLGGDFCETMAQLAVGERWSGEERSDSLAALLAHVDAEVAR